MISQFNKDVGQRIRAQREFLGMTREGLCTHVNISPQFLSEVERGIKGVSAETLVKLCNGLCLSSDYVLTGKVEPTDTSHIAATLAALNPEQVQHADELLKVFIRAMRMDK